MSEEAITPAPEAEAAEEKKTGRRLSAAEWADIVTHWELGTKKASEMAKEYGVTASAIYQHFEKNGIQHKSKAHTLIKEAQKRITSTVAAASPEITTFASKKRERIEATKEQGWQLTQLLLGLEGKVGKEIATAGLASPAHDLTSKVLKRMIDSTATIMDIRYRLLDVDGEVDEADLPTLTLMDLTKKDITDLQDQDFNLDEIMAIPDEDDEDDVVVVS